MYIYTQQNGLVLCVYIRLLYGDYLANSQSGNRVMFCCCERSLLAVRRTFARKSIDVEPVRVYVYMIQGRRETDSINTSCVVLLLLYMCVAVP